MGVRNTYVVSCVNTGALHKRGYKVEKRLALPRRSAP